MGIRYHDQLWWRGKYDERWQRNTNAYIYPCHCWDRKYQYQRQQYCSNNKPFHFVASFIYTQFNLMYRLCRDAPLFLIVAFDPCHTFSAGLQVIDW